MSKTKCPHSNITDCPLYHAAHDADMPFGCDDGQLMNWDGCAVARGMDYDGKIAAMRISHPGYAERIEWNKDARERTELRKRNMRLLRIH